MSVVRTLSKGVFVACDLFLKSPKGPRILIYHQVGAGLGRQMEVTLEEFKNQVGWLTANREVVTLDEAIRRWDEPDSYNLTVLTFDDGYADVYSTAFPALVKLDLPFLLYLTTGPVETGDALGPSPGADPLSWDMIRTMADSGLLTVGAHTHTHPDFRQTDPATVATELETSDRLIRERLGVEVEHFAYPWGFWSRVAHDKVVERYRTAVLTGSPNPSEAVDLHQIHRYPVQLSDRMWSFRARINGGLRAEEMVRRRINGYRGP